ncbi:MAG: hypothetical protein E6R13_00895 [Spirochaetes bacterium]|nr:MAG: hypothetical protein E6R13_00895 [Spirochaetota bacterium]
MATCSELANTPEMEKVFVALDPNNELNSNTAYYKAGLKALREINAALLPEQYPASLLQPSPEGTPIRERTVLADHIKVMPASKQTGMSAYLDNLLAWFKKDIVTEVLGRNTTENEENTIKSFREFFIKTSAKLNTDKVFNVAGTFIPSNLGKTQATAIPNQDKLFDSDLFRQLIDDKYQTKERVKAALTLAAYQAILDLANTPTDKKHVAVLLGIEPDEVTYEQLNRYRDKTTHPNTAFSKWGSYVFEALGLQAKPDSSENMVANFKTSLGAQVYQLLRAMQQVEVVTVPIDVWRNDVNKEVVAPDDGSTTNFKFFYKLVDGNQFTSSILDAQKNSGNVISKLFSYGGVDLLPSTEPITKVPTKTKTGQAVPEFLQKVLTKFQSTPFAFKANNTSHLLKFSTEKVDGVSLRERLLGISSDVEISRSQSTKRTGMQAKNEGLRREMQAMDTVLEAMGDGVATDPSRGFYLATDVWKMLRVGIKSSINPTSSKLHRYMITTQSWKADVKLGDTQSENNYLLRVAEGFGVSTDKKANTFSLEEFTTFISTDVFKAGLAAIRSNTVEYTEEQAQAILAVLDAAGFGGSERIKTFDALVSYSEFLTAKENNETTFTSDLMGEVDGVSNGPILTQLLFGVTAGALDMVSMFAKGGFYTDEDTKDFNVWRGTGNADFYEAGSQGIKEAVANNLKTGIISKLSKNDKVYTLEMTDATRAFADAMAFFMNDKDGNILNRNKVKGLFNPVTFGSGFGKAAISLLKGSPYGSLEDAVYSKIEELNERASDPEMTQDEYEVELKTLKENILALGIRLPSKVNGQTIAWDIIDLMESFQIDNNDRANMRALYMPEGNFKAGLGTFIEAAINEYFTAFVIQREAITNVTTTAANNYIHVRNYLIKTKLEEKGISFEKGKIPVGLSTEELQEIDSYLLSQGLTPVMDSFYGQEEGNPDAGLLLLQKTKGSVSTEDHKTQLTGSHPFLTGINKHLVGHSEGLVIASPGVLGTSVGTHSLDSNISFKRMHALFEQGIASLNMHDSGGTSFAHMPSMGIEFNKATFEAMVGYSPMTAIANMGLKNLSGYMDFLVNNPKATVDLAALSASIIYISNLIERAHIGTITKLNFLKEVKHVSQYAFEGGSYEVTTEDVKSVDKKLVDVEKEYQEQLEQLTVIRGMFENGFKNPSNAETETTETVSTVDPVSTTEDVNDEASVSDTAKPEDFFAEARNPEGVAMDVLLAKAYEKYDAVPFLQTLAKALKGVNAKVYAVENEEAIADSQDRLAAINHAYERRILGQTLAGAMAIPNDNGTNIYVFTKRTTASPILVLHESLHALLTGYLNATELTILDKKDLAKKENKEVKYTEAEQSYLTLVDLFNQVKAAIKANPEFESKLYPGLPELYNVDEFIAYGLTDKNFQTVLNQITLNLNKQARKTIYETAFNVINNGLTKFIVSVADFFGTSLKVTKQGTLNELQKDKLNNALVALFANSATVIADAKTGPDSPRKVVRAGQASNGLYTHSTLEVFEALGRLSTPLTKDVQDHLQSLVMGIANAAYGPMGTLATSRMRDTSLDEVATYEAALNAGELPIASAIANENLNFSAQESFAIDQVAMTVETAMSHPDFVKYRRTLEKLYVQAQEEVKPKDFYDGDWNTATPNEQAETTKLYNFIFDSKNTNGQALARFAAFGLASKQVMKALGGVTTKLPDVKIKNTLFSKLQTLFTQVLNFFVKKTTGVYSGQQLDTSIQKLVNNLVAAEAQRQVTLNHSGIMNRIEKGFNTGAKKLNRQVRKVAQSNFVQNNPINKVPGIGPVAGALLRTTGAVATTVLDKATEKTIEVSLQTRNRVFPGRFGLTAGIANEILGETDAKKQFYRLSQLVKHTESVRENIISSSAETTMKQFAETGRYLTKEHKASISSLLRTGLAGSSYDAAAIVNLVSQPASINTEIARIKNAIAALVPSSSRFLAYKAEATGYFLSTGNSHDRTFTAMNASQIIEMAKGVVTQGEASAITANTAALKPLLYDLISLQALRTMSIADRKYVQEVINKEMARGTDNGLTFVINNHKRLLNESKDRLFRGNDMQMQHGYLPEVVNPNVDVVYVVDKPNAPKQQQIDQLLRAGYKLIGDLPISSLQKAAPTMLVHENLPETRRLTGMFSFIDHKGKGSMLHAGLQDPVFAPYGKALNAKALALAQAEYRKIKASGFNFTYQNDKTMVALFDEQGNVVNYRHMASNKFKNNWLKRNNDFSFLLGKLEGSTFEKVKTKEQNQVVVDALKELYDREFAKNPQDYYFVGLKSKDKEYNEAYRLLPQATKDHIESVWGGKGMFVRKDMLDMVFGYRKLTLGDAMLQSKADQNLAVKLVTKIAEMAYARGGSASDKYAARVRASVLAKQIQRGWEEVVAETKDIIVLKTGFVLFGNETSNMTLLRLNGMGYIDALREKGKALAALNIYRDQFEELNRLQMYIATGTRVNEHSQFMKRIGLLQESINKNPVKKFIDAGFMPTIAEDVETISEDYSYKGKLFNLLEEKAKKFGKLGDVASSVTKQIYMSESTGSYQFMKYTTQVSDFTARYALYQHLSKKGTMSEADMMRHISRTFVNYDIPSHRLLEAANSVGLLMFTKYFLRIQAPLLETIRDNPLPSLQLMVLENYLGGLDTVMDSAFTEKFYNPLKWGAFELPRTFDDVLTVNAAISSASALIPGK